MWNNRLKAVTLSYDDGILQDKRLVKLFNKYNLKCTFNLNGGMLYNECVWTTRGVRIIRMTPEECIETFSGHEVASHSLTHPNLCSLADYELERQIMGDKKLLEYIFKNRIYGMAYPGGYYDDRVKNVVIKNIDADVVKAPERGIVFDEIWGNSIGGIIISGTKKNMIENLTLENINASLPGGVKEFSEREIPYIKNNYPEFHRMDPVSAKGIYLRDAKDVNLKNIVLSFKEEDVREIVKTENVKNLVSDV